MDKTVLPVISKEQLTEINKIPSDEFVKSCEEAGRLFCNKYENETLDAIAKTLEKYDIAEEFISIVALGIIAEHEKEKMQRKIEELNKTQYPISPFRTNV